MTNKVQFAKNGEPRGSRLGLDQAMDCCQNQTTGQMRFFAQECSLAHKLQQRRRNIQDLMDSYLTEHPRSNSTKMTKNDLRIVRRLGQQNIEQQCGMNSWEWFRQSMTQSKANTPL
jgi:hypothetical protein